MEKENHMTVSGRDAYRDELIALAGQNEQIICFEADLGGHAHPFEKKYPARFFNAGIAELATLDIAAGMAEAGFVPFFSSFAPFIALRAAEGIKLNMGYMGKNIKIVAPYGGVSGAWFGTTHHSLEDYGIVRTFPNIKIACPHGEIETRKVIRDAATSKSPYYVRLGRNGVFESLSSDHDNLSNWIIWQDKENSNAEVCLVSIGETGTEICKKLFNKEQKIIHAHLVYADDDSLEIYSKQLRSVANKFLVVEEHRSASSVASALALMMTDRIVVSANCGKNWPCFGGDHEDVLEELGLTLEIAQKTLEILTKSTYGGI